MKLNKIKFRETENVLTSIVPLHRKLCYFQSFDLKIFNPCYIVVFNKRYCDNTFEVK